MCAVNASLDHRVSYGLGRSPSFEDRAGLQLPSDASELTRLDLGIRSFLVVLLSATSHLLQLRIMRISPQPGTLSVRRAGIIANFSGISCNRLKNDTI